MPQLGVVFALVLLVLFPASAATQTKQPLTHELLWSFRRVGAPAPSPDGKWVVFSVPGWNGCGIQVEVLT